MTVTSPARTITFTDVFAIRDFRALWCAQVLSVTGDQFARVALSVLVYDRTRSPFLAAVMFAASVLPQFAGGLFLAWLADRFRRRTVMITCDVISLALVLAMTIAGLPLAALIGLLGAVSLAAAPFFAARSATNREVLGKDKYQLGSAITQSTYQIAQITGFAAGGVTTALAGIRGALLIDAATFAASAMLIAIWVTSRPAGRADKGTAKPGRLQWIPGARLVFSSPVARTAMLLAWLAAFYNAPEAIAAPLSRTLHGGAAMTGLLLTAMAAGAAAGMLAFGRLVPAARRTRLAALLASGACGVLVLFTFGPDAGFALAILAVSGVLSCYMIAATGTFADVIPGEHRGKAFGLASAGLSLSQAAGYLTAGALARVFGPGEAIAQCGILGAICALLLAPVWRNLVPRLLQGDNQEAAP